jgi:hypothetical protein
MRLAAALILFTACALAALAAMGLRWMLIRGR